MKPLELVVPDVVEAVDEPPLIMGSVFTVEVEEVVVCDVNLEKIAE